jgi:isoleucyl-tRNA synthetase
LLHPICPFTTEYLYASFGEKKSILLENWPTPQKSLVDDSVEEAFDLLKEVISISAAARMKGKLKRRWPLNEAIICVEPLQQKKLESLSNLLLSQLNIEKYKIIELEKSEGLELVANLLKYNLPIIPKIEFDRKKIGPKAKQVMGKLLSKFETTPPQQIVGELLKKGTYSFDLGGTNLVLDKDDFVIDFVEQDKYAMARHESQVVFISTSRNREMMARGMVRDVARRLQVLRKERGYNPTDILDAAYILDLDEESLEMIKEKQGDLAFLVRVKRVEFSDKAKVYKEDDVDGQKIRISVE